MVLKYMKVLLDSIEREKAGSDYFYSTADREVLNNIFAEVEEYTKTSISSLAEIAALNIPGAGEIYSRYVSQISSESVKSFLIPQIVTDKVKDRDFLLIQMYLQFKESNEYISAPNSPSPAHICARYDYAFAKIKSKRIMKDLVLLAQFPRDAYYLPSTMRMLASWKVPALKNLLMLYSSENNISAQDIGIYDLDNEYFPPFSFIKRELRFLAIDALKYYPCDDVYKLIERYVKDIDPNVRAVASKTIKYLIKR